MMPKCRMATLINRYKVVFLEGTFQYPEYRQKTRQSHIFTHGTRRRMAQHVPNLHQLTDFHDAYKRYEML